MKVVYAVPRYLPHLGGVENHVQALAARLAADGHRVTVATQAGKSERLPSVERPAANLTVLRFPSVLPARGQGVSASLWNWLRLGAGDADVVHVHNYHAASALGCLAAARGPVVFTPHYLGSGEGSIEAALHAAYAAGMRRVLPRVAHTICVARSEADAFRNIQGTGSACSVIPNGVDQFQIRCATPIEVSGRLVVFAGRLEPHKRPDALVQALQHLPADFRVAVLGDGSMRECLALTGRTLGLGDRLIMTGALPVDEVYRWYRAADTVVTLSRRECFGMTVAEALAAGARVIASDIGPHRDVLGLADAPRAALVPVDADAAGLAAAIRALGPKDATTIVPSLPTWDQVAVATAQVYERVLRESKPVAAPAIARGLGRASSRIKNPVRQGVQ